MTFDSPAPVMARLEEIERDLACRQGEYEAAARDRARLARDWDYRLAVARVEAQGSDADARKASALVKAIETDDLYDRLRAAEAAFEALKVVVKTLETRSVIGTSILRAHGRA